MSNDGQHGSHQGPIHPSDAADAARRARQASGQHHQSHHAHQTHHDGGLQPMPQLALVAQPYKDTTASWLLLLFLGGMGGHDFYLRDPGLGVVKLVIFLISAPLTLVVIGYVPLFGLFIWNAIDAIRMSGRVQNVNTAIWHENRQLPGMIQAPRGH